MMPRKTYVFVHKGVENDDFGSCLPLIIAFSLFPFPPTILILAQPHEITTSARVNFVHNDTNHAIIHHWRPLDFLFFIFFFERGLYYCILLVLAYCYVVILHYVFFVQCMYSALGCYVHLNLE